MLFTLSSLFTLSTEENNGSTRTLYHPITPPHSNRDLNSSLQHNGIAQCVTFKNETFYCLPLSSSYKTAHWHWPHINVCRVPGGGVVNMLIVLSITSYFQYNIWGCMCSTGPFKYRWLKGLSYSSCYYHHQIGSIHFPIVIIFFHGCVSEMFVTSYSVTYCIYIRGKPGICFQYYCAVYDECK